MVHPVSFAGIRGCEMILTKEMLNLIKSACVAMDCGHCPENERCPHEESLCDECFEWADAMEKKFG